MFQSYRLYTKFVTQILFVLCSSLCLLPLNAFAVDPYPNKPIRLIVAFAPGGPVDSTARILAVKLSEILKQSVFVENKAGAGSNIGTQYAAGISDGYTFLVNSTAFAVNPTLYGPSAGYNPEKDFTPVIVASTQPNVISVNEKVPVKSLSELKEYATKEKLAFSSPGSGTTPQLTCEHLFKVVWKSDITHIPYKGAGPASMAVVAGETPVACTAVTGVYQFSKQGKVRIIAVSSDKRLPNLPDVPTLSELGYKNFNDYTWTGFFASSKTPMDMVIKMNQAINEALKDPDVISKFEQSGLGVVGGNTSEAKNYISSEVKHWSQAVKDTGAKVD